MLGYVVICLDMFGYVWICSYMFGYVQICLQMFEFVQICMDIFRYVCSNILNQSINVSFFVGTYISFFFEHTDESCNDKTRVGGYAHSIEIEFTS